MAVTTTQQDDPYEVLNLPHSATEAQIKRAYRALARQHHPDRLKSSGAADKCTASKDFAQVAAAYALLNDPQRKAQYDHRYKYGGFDDTNTINDNLNHEKNPRQPKDEERHRREQQQRASKGIGYTCTDPFLSYVWTQGRIHSTRTVAGIEIPSRFAFQRGRPGSVRVAISSGQFFTEDPATGTRAYRSQTTHFTEGQKFTRSETTIVHPSGLKEVLVVDNSGDGSGSTTRRYVVHPSRDNASTRNAASRKSWLDELKDKMTMCYKPNHAKMVL